MINMKFMQDFLLLRSIKKDREYILNLYQIVERMVKPSPGGIKCFL